MKREDLVKFLSWAIAEREGFYVKQAEALARGQRWPTRAQRNYNPGNIRRWATLHGIQYPKSGGYVDLLKWAKQVYPQRDGSGDWETLALAEGWRMLAKLVGHYLDGRYTGGEVPTLQQMFRVYAPSADANDPESYAKFVAERVGIAPDVPLVAENLALAGSTPVAGT
jgi:hypothetical protein